MSCPRGGGVLDDTWLFEGTIGNKIAYGRPPATETEIEDAARAAYFVRCVGRCLTIRHCPGGRGVERVGREEADFDGCTVVLILEETTSSIHTRTEVLVLKVMSELRSDRTSFNIAHRISRIRGADLFLVIEAGQIVEQSPRRVAGRCRGLCAAVEGTARGGGGGGLRRDGRAVSGLLIPRHTQNVRYPSRSPCPHRGT